MEKLALALIIASRKLRHYFHAYSIKVFTNFPLNQVLQKPKASGRLLKWAVKLSQFDNSFQPRTTIKGQALADFIAEFMYDVNLPTKVIKKPVIDLSSLWKLYVDGSSNENGASASLVLISPEGHNIHYALRFKFPVSNNEAEYEALIAGLKLAQKMKAEMIEVYSDSQLVVCQVIGDYQARGERMIAYLQEVQRLFSTFTAYNIQLLPCIKNTWADALAKLPSTKDAELLKMVLVEFLAKPSIEVEL
ncbi:Ribonuclease H [Parasponia andersonii]|uniref:Ribonuclease H n=1 Tax=Parasponia andersonii TaxID=3476 RepID=A0A2P5DNS2_PARAD|nr:Ribonuclease H [Parasponia andersonii]